MDNFNQKLRDRWQQKRKKASNWTGLLIKVLILVALVFVIRKLSKSENIDWSRLKTGPDTMQVAPDTTKGQ
jgi:hypothetical protein